MLQHGHIAVYVPGDPHARPDGYALEHRLVMASVIGRPLGRDEIVHHINGNPADNRPENLEVMSQAEHIRRHTPERVEA